MNETVQRAKRPETCRMFENEVLEKFSRIHPVTPFVVYVPMIVVLLYRAYTRHVGFLTAAGLFVGGVFVWTFAEYILHRYVFHWYKDTPFGRRVHFLLHGVHHDFPNDGDRLVMPLLTSIPLAVIFYTAFYFAFGGARLAEPFFAGFALGYLAYDGTHYAVHHFKQTSRIGKFVKRHHMLHHHADHDGGFGVSSPIWDYVFGTMPQVKKLAATRAATDNS
ncbi:MAG TPA: sterol desaturase family protein [Labilithrix sp.]|nr:sterol desaturase family protein [Labilithrix sp.]